MTFKLSIQRNISNLSKSDLIVDSMVEMIRNGTIPPGGALPSIKDASLQHRVARKTIVRSYEKMKKQGFIESRPRKGYYVISRQSNSKIRILLLVHSFDAHFEFLYHSFRSEVEETSEIEIFFHHYNIKLFELIISRNIDAYDLFIVSSFDHARIPVILSRIPANKVLVISRNDKLEKRYNSIFQDFNKGTFEALNSIKSEIKNYNGLVLSFPLSSGHSKTLQQGFERFCEQAKLPFVVVDTLNNLEIKKGNLYLVIDDQDLIKLLRFCKIRNWTPGKDIGVISYNETPLKEVIREGITVISCSFKQMALEMAAFVKNRTAVYKTIPIQVIKRNSH